MMAGDRSDQLPRAGSEEHARRRNIREFRRSRSTCYRSPKGIIPFIRHHCHEPAGGWDVGAKNVHMGRRKDDQRRLAPNAIRFLAAT